MLTSCWIANRNCLIFALIFEIRLVLKLLAWLESDLWTSGKSVDIAEPDLSAAVNDLRILIWNENMVDPHTSATEPS